MTIDEAIAHALEMAGEQQERADSAELIDILDGLDVEACKECAVEHRQLAEWLKELKSLRKKAEHLTEWNRKLIDYKNKIICKWGKSQEELQEAKRLLKVAVGDFKWLEQHTEDDLGGCVINSCDKCPLNIEGAGCKWKHEAEALKLIGDESNEI